VDGPLDNIIFETLTFLCYDSTDRQPYRNYGAKVL